MTPSPNNISTIFTSPRLAAAASAVTPLYRSSGVSTFAPIRSNTTTTSPYPPSTAACSAVRPSLCAALPSTSAPASRSLITIPRRPFSAAACSAVRPAYRATGTWKSAPARFLGAQRDTLGLSSCRFLGLLEMLCLVYIVNCTYTKVLTRLLGILIK